MGGAFRVGSKKERGRDGDALADHFFLKGLLNVTKQGYLHALKINFL